MMLLRMFPDRPEFARERRTLERMVVASLAAAIVTVAISIAQVLS